MLAADEWRALMRDALARHDWEEVLLAATPILAVERSPDAGLDEVSMAFGKAASCVWKGLPESANAAWELLKHCRLASMRHVACCGVGVALGALVFATDAKLKQQLLLFQDDLHLIEPFLARVQALSSCGPNLVVMPDNEQLLQADAALTDEESIVLLDVSRAGLTQSQSGAACALHAQLSMGSAVHFCPRTVEVWVMVVCAHGTPWESDRTALHELLKPPSNVPSAAAEGVTLQPVLRVTEGGCGSGIPIYLSAWAHTRLCEPVRLSRWTAEGSSKKCRADGITTAQAAVLFAEVCCTCDGPAEAVIVWTEVEAAQGVWISRACRLASPDCDNSQRRPVAGSTEDGTRSGSHQSRLAGRSADSPREQCRIPSADREPQLAFPVAPLAVERGSRLVVVAEHGACGVQIRRLEPASPPGQSRGPSSKVGCVDGDSGIGGVAGGVGGVGGVGDVGGVGGVGSIGGAGGVGDVGGAGGAGRVGGELDLSGSLPAWTAFMLNDMERARKYDEALRRAMRLHARTRTHVTVVDLGAGAGLLSLLAAHAAAAAGLNADIYAVEREPQLAALCRAVFEANHTSVGIHLHVIEADSTAVSVQALPEKPGESRAIGVDGGRLPERAHVLVSEVLGDEALAEGALPSLRHATATLLHRTCGVAIPSQFTLCAAVVALPANVDRAATLCPEMAHLGGGLLSSLTLGRAGVDLRSARMDAPRATGGAPPREDEACASPSAGAASEPPAADLAAAARAHAPPPTMLTDGVDLCTISLARPPPAPPPGHPLVVGEASAALRSGMQDCTPSAVVSWFTLTLFDDVTLSSSPDSSTHWRQVAHLVPLPHRQPLAELAAADAGGRPAAVRLRYIVHEEESWVRLII